MDSYRTEEEQVEALKRWWEENGRSTLAAIAVALAAAFGWQGWQGYQQGQTEGASDAYQALLGSLSNAEELEASRALADQLISDFPSTTYAQFAALHLAAMAVQTGQLDQAEAQLRWVLSNAATGGDTAHIAQLRLARVLAASGSIDQALAVLDDADSDYEASYAAARGDILLAAGRADEAREAYTMAQTLVALGGQGSVNIPSLQLKLQALSPQTAISLEESESAARPSPVDAATVDADIESDATVPAMNPQG